MNVTAGAWRLLSEHQRICLLVAVSEYQRKHKGGMTNA